MKAKTLVWMLVALIVACGCHKAPELPNAQLIPAGNPADQALANKLIGIWKGTVPSPSGGADKTSYEDYKADGTVSEALFSPDMPAVKFTAKYSVRSGKLALTMTGSSGMFGTPPPVAFQVSETTLRIGANSWTRQPAGTVIPNAPEAFSGGGNASIGGRIGPGGEAQIAPQPGSEEPSQSDPGQAPPSNDPSTQTQPPWDTNGEQPQASQGGTSNG